MKPSVFPSFLLVISCLRRLDRLSSVLCLLILFLLSSRAESQQLEAAGCLVSLDVTQTFTKPIYFNMGPYTLNTGADPSNIDDVGYRLSAFGRWRIGGSHFFAQPELAYTSTAGQAYEYTNYPAYYYPLPGPFGADGGIFRHKIRRWEFASLVGLHTGRRTYLILGPVFALNRREDLLTPKPGYPAIEELYNSLTQSVNRVQLLAQVGAGATFGRFDFNLRFEQSMTPYTRRFTFDGTTYNYEQRIRQGLFTVGFALYRSRGVPMVPVR